MHKHSNFIRIYLFFLILVFSIGCDKGSNLINTRPLDVKLKIVRYEKLLFGLSPYSISDSSAFINTNYPEFTPLFSNKIIEIGDPSEEYFGEKLSLFITDQAVYNIYKSVEKKFPDLNQPTQELENAFGRFSFLFPEKNIPTIYTYISGLNQSIVTAEDIIGISLEKYLGENNPLYDQVYPPIPNYLRKVMIPEKIPSDIIKAWISTEFGYAPEMNNLLSNMIYQGRTMFLTKQLMPEIPDTLLWGFSSQQLEFCKTHESQMYTYLVEQGLLFSTDKFRITQFIEEAPFTKDFTNESPGKAVVWMGYRIAEDYFKRNSALSVEEFMAENNYQKILNGARYNP